MLSRGRQLLKLALEKNRDSNIETMSSNSTECSIQNENLNHSFEAKLDVTSETINEDINVDQNNNEDAEFESSDDFFDDDVLDQDYKLPPKRKRRQVSTNADSFLKCNETLTSSEESTTDYSSDEYETPITIIQNLSRNSLAENKSDPCQTQDYQDDVLISNAVVDPNEIMSNSVRENVCGTSGVQETEMNQETQMEQNEVSIDAAIDHEEEIEAEERREESDPVQVREQITESTKGQKRRNKLLRERGLAYKGHKRNEEGHHKLSEDRKERVLREKQCSKLCKKMKKPRFCHSISEVDRQRMFSRFWYQMSWEEKKIYVIGLVEKGEKQSATLPDGAVGRRKFSYKYYLRVGDERKEVCRDMFLSTLGLTDKIVYDWINNSEGGVPKSKQPRKMSAREIQSLDAREHAKTYLNELPKVPSHYCRANSKKHYLEPVFNSMADLHREYLRKLQEESKPCVNYNIFKKMFKDMNFCLYKPKKDMCDLCTGYKAGTVDEVEYTAHIAKKTEAQNSKAADKETGKTNSKVKVVTVDLQSLLLCPQLNASCLYYKTKLSCHNYTIYDLVTKDVVCYFWNETDGDLSSNVFTSCMIDYLESLDLTGVETVIIYSDGCGYQNRNVTLANALLKFATERHVTIEQKYLERGHTYMECDSTHSVIEHQIRSKQIYLPQQFVENIEAARQDNPYVVKYVDFTFFKDYSTLDKYTSIRPGIGVGSATVADVRQLKYDPDGIIYYKTGYENCTYEPLPNPRRKGSTAANPEQLYHMALPLKKSKYTHLQQIKQVIPKDYHSFYDSLPNHNS